LIGAYLQFSVYGDIYAWVTDINIVIGEI